MISIPAVLALSTVFAILLPATQSVAAAAAMTASMFTLIHLYAAIAVIAVGVLAVAALADWYTRTNPGTVYTATDHASVTRVRVQQRR